jgi:hypothetical protein
MTSAWTNDFPCGNRLFRREKAGLPAEGLEPTHCCQYWILSPARLPFRHAGVSGNGAKEYELRAEAQTFPTRSSGCMLRGGPKISRKMIASLKPDGDFSIEVRSIFRSVRLEMGTAVTG